MKPMKKLIPILGLAGLALSGIPAHAQLFNYGDGNLILDFSQAAASADLEVNLGSLSSLNSLAQAACGTVSLGNFSSQLTLAGASVNSLTFSVVGLQLNSSGSVAATTEYLTQTQTGVSPNSPPKDLTPSNQSAVESKILGILGLNSDGSLGTKGILPWSAAQPAGANNTASAVIIGNTDINSFTKIVGASFGPVNPKDTTPALFSSGSVVSDLFEYDPVGSSQNTVYQGYFTFSSDGSLNYTTASPVPEPGVAVLAAGGLLVLALRQRFQRNKA